MLRSFLTKNSRATRIFHYLPANSIQSPPTIYPLYLTNYYSSFFSLSDDCLHILRTQYRDLPLPNNEEAKQEIAEDFCLHFIRIRLEENNISFTRDIRLSESFGLPEIQREYKQYHADGRNRLLREELAYETDSWQQMWPSLNAGQTAAAEAIWDAISQSNGQLFFLDGYGGTGKTMLQNTVLRRVRHESNVAIAVASSGIASILLQGGRTAHSRFKIPLNATAQSNCGVSVGFDLSELLIQAKVIWALAASEAPYGCSRLKIINQSINHIEKHAISIIFV